MKYKLHCIKQVAICTVTDTMSAVDNCKHDCLKKVPTFKLSVNLSNLN